MTPYRTSRNRWHKMLAAIVLAAILNPIAFADEKKEDKPKDISDYMDVIGDNQKKLKRSARNKDFNDESVKLVAEMIAAATTAREMTPPMADKITDTKKKEEFIAGYKKEIDGLIAELTKLETALKEKKTDDAVKIIANIDALKKQGHDKYVEE